MEDKIVRIERLEHEWRTLHEKCRQFHFTTVQSLPLLRQTDYMTSREIAERLRHFNTKSREDFDAIMEELVSGNILNFFGVKKNSEKTEPLYHPFVIVLESAVEHDKMQLAWAKSAILSNLLAILEPAYWPKVTETTTYSVEALNIISLRETGKELDVNVIFGLGLESPAHLAIESERERYKSSTLKLVKELGANLVKSLHRYLDRRAHQIDRNADLYLLVRSLPEKLQSNLASAFGLSVHYRKLAEMVRIAYEETFSEYLDEEGSRFSNQSSAILVRELGTDRPITNIDRARPYVARLYNISDKITIRCYVEGQTEKAFMDTILGAYKKELGVEIVNLKGKLTTRKGISLKDMLEEDLEAERYSYLLCDNDRDDVIRELN